MVPIFFCQLGVSEKFQLPRKKLMTAGARAAKPKKLQ
jgi:hypothetical protein